MATYRFKFDLVEPVPTRSMAIRAAAQKMHMTPNDFCRVAALGMADMILSEGRQNGEAEETVQQTEGSQATSTEEGDPVGAPV